jgi:DNA polymerase-3 subunit epsilon
MTWFGRFFRSRSLSDVQRAAIDAYRRVAAPDLGRDLQGTRFIVADVETSGLNPYRDRLISIGAIVVENGDLDLGQSFETVLKQTEASAVSNILVHGIDGTTQMSGVEPGEGLLAFLEFAGKSPMVGYHANFDRVVIERACKKILGVRPQNLWLDLAILAPSLCKETKPKGEGLDAWLDAYGIDNYARHDAVADALATAELFLIVLAAARRQDQTSCADLVTLEKNERLLAMQ